MLNKINTKSLLFLLVILVAIVVIVRLNGNNAPESSMPKHLVEVDSAAVNRLLITTKGELAYELLREGGKWKLKLADGKLVAVKSKMLNTSFSSLLEAEPKRIVTRNEEKWAGYEVTDQMATLVQFFNNEEELAGLYIGKFDFNQQTSSISNFVRQKDKAEVLLCNQPLSFDWGKKASDWRDNTVLSASIASINKIAASGLQNFTLVKDDLAGWQANGLELDSTQIQTYIAGLANLTSKQFDDVTNLADLSSPEQSIQVYTELEDFTLNIYSTTAGKLITSSENPKSLFVLDSVLEQKLLPQIKLIVEEVE